MVSFNFSTQSSYSMLSNNSTCADRRRTRTTAVCTYSLCSTLEKWEKLFSAWKVAYYTVTPNLQIRS